MPNECEGDNLGASSGCMILDSWAGLRSARCMMVKPGRNAWCKNSKASFVDAAQCSFLASQTPQGRVT